LSVAQVALIEQVPVEAVIVIVALALAEAPLTAPAEQAPLPLMVGTTLAFVVAVTVNVDPSAALAGAPVNFTVGAILVAVTLADVAVAAL
jgi:hypothetical protein